MGLLNTTNSIGQELKTARQQKEQERQEKKRRQLLKERDKFDLQFAESEMMQKLDIIFSEYFESNEPKRTYIFLQSKSGVDSVAFAVVKNELDSLIFRKVYNKQLNIIYKLYLNQNEYQKMIDQEQAKRELERIEEERKTEEIEKKKQAVLTVTLLSLMKIICRILLLCLCFFAGTTKILFEIFPKSHRTR